MTAILLVDPDAERRRAIRDQFQTHSNWKLMEASTAAEGQALFLDHSIELVVLDLESVGPAGEEMFEWIRADQARVPVVLLTSDDVDEQARVDALVMGAASYVPMSFVARDLAVTVERILNLSGCRRRHARLSEGLVTTETNFRIDDNDLSMLPVLIGHLIDTAEEIGAVTAKNRMQLAVALEEALTNSIIHGNLEVSSELRDGDGVEYRELIEKRRGQPSYATRRLFVCGEFEQKFCRITITDEGPGFDPAEVDDPTDPAHVDRTHGRGLFLIRAFMDEVEFNRAGNQIRLVKRASAAAVKPEDGC